MNIRNHLDNEIQKFRYENNRYPQGILVHPITKRELEIHFKVIEVINSSGIYKYMDIIMYRSLDVNIGEFKIL